MVALHIQHNFRILIISYLSQQECWVQLYLCMAADAAGTAAVFSRGQCIYAGVSAVGKWATPSGKSPVLITLRFYWVPARVGKRGIWKVYGSRKKVITREQVMAFITLQWEPILQTQLVALDSLHLYAKTAF